MTLHLIEDDYHSGTVVDTSVTTNSLSKDYPHPDDHAIQTVVLLWIYQFNQSSHNEILYIKTRFPYPS